jgi:putative addiction module component (TIGR02574 family)
MPHKSFDFSQLSSAERIHLVQDLWDSIHEEALASALTPEEQAELDRRHADLESGAVKGITLDELKQSLLSRR